MEAIIALLRKWPEGLAIFIIVSVSLTMHQLYLRLWIIDYIKTNVPPAHVSLALSDMKDDINELKIDCDKVKTRISNHIEKRDAHHEFPSFGWEKSK